MIELIVFNLKIGLFKILIARVKKIDMKIVFDNIPEASRFTVFDLANKDAAASWEIPIGDLEIEYEIPAEWSTPYYSLRSSTYYIPNEYNSLSGPEISFSGDDYYLDISRENSIEELNQESVESLITGVQNNDKLDFRQKFYISLVSLQSYFEYLTYGIIVLSGFKTEADFGALRTANNRINSGFSNGNTDFFSDQIHLCPGKENLGRLITDEERDRLRKIFHMIRDMRNAVVHAWSYNNLTKHEINGFFQTVGEHVDVRLSASDFYRDATQNFIRLYAKVDYIRSQLMYFKEREYIRAERQERGY